jgi:hypothetical protein
MQLPQPGVAFGVVGINLVCEKLLNFNQFLFGQLRGICGEQQGCKQ